eukprot:TRINITY_DN932_c0_g1_i1.p1 TRINITY_DN932_c0_g1~~TRINITY_DN932_c0_g1_i1.p1  ORF type:complete len:305 (+),score=33.84 TRINITY_DN932_c0_g1_i1:81-995(+)
MLRGCKALRQAAQLGVHRELSKKSRKYLPSSFEASERAKPFNFRDTVDECPMETLVHMPIDELQDLYCEGGITPSQFFKRIQVNMRFFEKFNFFVNSPRNSNHFSADAVQSQAANAVPLKISADELEGTFCSVKDSIGMKGVDESARDHALVAAIRRSGAIILGKTIVPEDCARPQTNTVKQRYTHNPHNPDYSCGGSSGGAAGSIAAGIGHFAIASDSSGSIRLPAALCGIVGFKAGKWSLPWAEHTGILARSVRDVATVLNWTSEQDRESPDRDSVLNPRFWQDKMVSKKHYSRGLTEIGVG